MNILYICYMNLETNGTVGIRKKIKSQIKEFETHGFTVDYVWKVYDGIETTIKSIKDTKRVISSNDINKVLLNVDLKQYDAIYMRFNRLYFSHMKLLKCARKSVEKIVMEIPTYPFYDEIIKLSKRRIMDKNYLGGIAIYLGYLCTKFNDKSVKSYVDRIVTYSNDSLIWGVNTICISNSADTSLQKSRETGNLCNKELHLLAVSGCDIWHGYDRVIGGLKDYYLAEYDIDVYFHIVGEGPEVPRYKELVDKMRLGSKVIFHGRRSGKELDAIFDMCDIGLDAMGRHRVGVYYNSTLKGKEYMMRGLPIVSGVNTELDQCADYPYYFRVPANDDNINITDIVRFYIDLGDEHQYKKEIRKYAQEHFSFSACYQPVIDYIMSEGYRD